MDLSLASRSTTRRSVRLWHVFSALALASLAAACGAEGPAGPAGVQGDPGTKGEDGTDGDDGDNGTDGTNGDDGKDGEDLTVDPSLSLLEKAYLGAGGKQALLALTSLKLTAEGANWTIGEGYESDDVGKFTTYKVAVEQDLGVDSAGLRADYEREVTFFGFPQPLSYKEIIKGNLGVTEGTVSIFGAPAGDMPSDRWASSLKTQRLLNPQLILKDIAADESIASDGGAAVLDGALHRLIVVEDEVFPITLWISAQTGKLTKLSTMENDHVRRDVPLEVFYEDWRASAQGLRYPAQVYLAHDEVIIRQESRSDFSTNEVIAATEFDFPVGSAPTHDEALAKHGAANSQFNQLFAAIGIPIDGLQTFVQPTQVSPGVWQLLGGSHNTMVIEQTDGLVMVEAPLYNERTDAVLAWAKTQYPNKPVKWVMLTHFHDDHIGGLRAFAAENVTIVVGAASEPFIMESLTAPSTVVPDKLAMNGGKYKVISVGKGESFTIADALRPVTSYSFDSVHAADMMMVYVPSAKTVWATDIFSAVVPVPDASQNFLAQQLHTAITQTWQLDVQTLITGHGNGANTFAEFQTVIGL